MSRILIDAREYSTSTGRYVSRLLQYLQHLDQTNYYLILLKPQDFDKVSFQNPCFQKIICPYKEFTFAEQLKLLRQITKLKPDLVHFAMVQQPILYRGPTVTTMHDLTTLRFDNPAKNQLVFKAKQHVYKAVNRIAAHKSKAIITPTEFVKQDVVNYTHIDPAKVTVTYEAADAISDPAEPLQDLSNKPFIMYVGRPTPHKNLGRLIDAFAILQQSHPELRLVLAGKEDVLYRRHHSAVESRGIQNVTFTGFISEGQLRWLYEHCQAYVFPSLSEGFGLPGLEAMVHGAPVISSNATCLPEVYGDAAAYFNPFDVKDMAAKIDHVLSADGIRQQLITTGYSQVQKYSWQRMAEQTLDIYRSVLKP